MSQAKYVISTEDSPNLPGLVIKFFPPGGFRIIKAEGYYKGVRERSAHIEIITAFDQDEQIKALAFEIKKFNLQEAVLIEKYPVIIGLV